MAELGVRAKGCVVLFGINKEPLKLIVVMDAQHCEFANHHCMVHFKWVHCLVYELSHLSFTPSF